MHLVQILVHVLCKKEGGAADSSISAEPLMARAAEPMDDPTAELLEAPLRGDGSSSGEDSDSSGPRWETADMVPSLHQCGMFLLDVTLSVPFWYVLFFVAVTDQIFYIALAVIGTLMVAWRVYRVQCNADTDLKASKIPYTCGFASCAGRRVYLVATIHISPRAPADVHKVVDTVEPDVVMIELDDERLDKMRDLPAGAVPQAKPEELQPLRITSSALAEPLEILAQKAVWNGEWEGKIIAGRVVWDEGNAHGLHEFADKTSDTSNGPAIALVLRGNGPNGEFGPFALKAFKANQGGAQAVLVICQENQTLPFTRVGGHSTLQHELRLLWMTHSCGFPPVPLLVLPHDKGKALKELCLKSNHGLGSSQPWVEFQVVEDPYPRRTLRLQLCQNCALLFSGIGILYGVIQCCSVEVGAEFLEAEKAAKAKGIPCKCIDVDLNRFWARLGSALLPTPCNLLWSISAWLAFPRVLVKFLFPPRGAVDVLGTIILHLTSFPLKTWAAFILAGACASWVSSNILALFGSGVEHAAEGTGVLAKEDRDAAQAWIVLAIELYMLPRIYHAVANSRDEAMYQNIVTKAREGNSKEIVVVIGAGHSNGILQRIWERGL